MKHHAIIIAAASLLLASCTAHYVATDRVTRHLDGSRSIFTSCSDTSLFKGWQEDITNCTCYEELPELTKEYLKGLEKETGCVIRKVSVGASREKTFFVK